MSDKPPEGSFFANFRDSINDFFYAGFGVHERLNIRLLTEGFVKIFCSEIRQNPCAYHRTIYSYPISFDSEEVAPTQHIRNKFLRRQQTLKSIVEKFLRTIRNVTFTAGLNLLRC